MKKKSTSTERPSILVKTVDSAHQPTLLAPSSSNSGKPTKVVHHKRFNFGCLGEDGADTYLDRLYFEANPSTPAKLEQFQCCPTIDRASQAIRDLVRNIDEDPTILPALRSEIHPLLRCLVEYLFLPEAQATLLVICEYLIGHLDNVDCEKLKPLAQTRHHWPALVSVADLKSYIPIKGMSSLKSRLESMTLGAETETANWQNSAESNRLALVMFQTIKDNQELFNVRHPVRKHDLNEDACKRDIDAELPDWVKQCVHLPPLTEPRAWEMWFDVGWQSVLEVTNGRPETEPSLRPLGLYRAEHSRHVGAQRRASKGTAEANIRDGIKTALKAAFRRVVRKKPAHVRAD